MREGALRRHSRHVGCTAVTVHFDADVIDVTAAPDRVAVWATRLGHSVITGGPEGPNAFAVTEVQTARFRARGFGCGRHASQGRDAKALLLAAAPVETQNGRPARCASTELRLGGPGSRSSPSAPVIRIDDASYCLLPSDFQDNTGYGRREYWCIGLRLS